MKPEGAGIPLSGRISFVFTSLFAGMQQYRILDAFWLWRNPFPE
jgi:hypothetical protein